MVLTCFTLLMPASSLVGRPVSLTAFTFVQPTTLPYHFYIPGFGIRLSPVTFSAQVRLTSELLRTL